MDSHSSTSSIAATATATSQPSANATASRSEAVKAVGPDKGQSRAVDVQPVEAATLQRDPRSLQFQVDGNRVITTIIDENDKTVVVQIPDADLIRIAKAIDRMQGFLIEQKA